MPEHGEYTKAYLNETNGRIYTKTFGYCLCLGRSLYDTTTAIPRSTRGGRAGTIPPLAGSVVSNPLAEPLTQTGELFCWMPLCLSAGNVVNPLRIPEPKTAQAEETVREYLIPSPARDPPPLLCQHGRVLRFNQFHQYLVLSNDKATEKRWHEQERALGQNPLITIVEARFERPLTPAETPRRLPYKMAGIARYGTSDSDQCIALVYLGTLETIDIDATQGDWREDPKFVEAIDKYTDAPVLLDSGLLEMIVEDLLKHLLCN